MSYRIKWFGVTFLFLAMVLGAQYIRAAVAHHETRDISAPIAGISPEELMRSASALAVTSIDSYF
jgi:hypothetical protein